MRVLGWMVIGSSVNMVAGEAVLVTINTLKNVHIHWSRWRTNQFVSPSSSRSVAGWENGKKIIARRRNTLLTRWDEREWAPKPFTKAMNEDTSFEKRVVKATHQFQNIPALVLDLVYSAAAVKHCASRITMEMRGKRADTSQHIRPAASGQFSWLIVVI